MRREYTLGGIALFSTIVGLGYPQGALNPSFLTGKVDSPVTTGSSSTTKLITGNAVATHYGYVQVEIQVIGEEITGIQMLQAPDGRDQQWTDASVPILIAEALESQSADIGIVSGATSTSEGFIDSLSSAISQI
ncbi:MAG: hypothetical protein RL038_439 [Actinomycetota bacterium]